VVPLQERLATRLRDLAAKPEAQARARGRLARALGLARIVETLVGEPAETVARRALAAADQLP